MEANPANIEKTKIAIIGAGAAGLFAAIHCAQNYPMAMVRLFEKTGRALAKVRISGGGRCNVTHNAPVLSQLLKGYPRGAKVLGKVFKQFGQPETVKWFEDRDVKLKIESDGRMFPVSDNSETVVRCLMEEADRLKVKVYYKAAVSQIIPGSETEKGLWLHFTDSEPEWFSQVIVTTGGSPHLSGLEWLAKLGHEIVPPVPSLFTFNIHVEALCELQGLSVPNVSVSLTGTKQVHQGAILVTHWGLSGPAVLKLSAFAARELAECAYKHSVTVRWLPENSEDEVRQKLLITKTEQAGKLIANTPLFDLPKRLWQYLLDKAEMPPFRWADAPKLPMNRMVNLLMNDTYKLAGKTTFKDEFVTAGGVSVQSVDFNTMQSKICQGLYFAGEVLDVDGITGGFNFQAAWSTAAVAGKLLD